MQQKERKRLSGRTTIANGLALASGTDGGVSAGGSSANSRGRSPGILGGQHTGFVLYAGEEASATGVGMHLRDDDRLASNHRGHGHCIAKGVEVKGMMAEIYGKRTGTCRGKGGSMHIADLDPA
jgi:TPP-dependent pyruvate/acetoin dehydrogenase alpha subunit